MAGEPGRGYQLRDPQLIAVSTSLTREEVAAIDALAIAEKLSRSAMLARLIRQELKA